MFKLISIVAAFCITSASVAYAGNTDGVVALAASQVAGVTLTSGLDTVVGSSKSLGARKAGLDASAHPRGGDAATSVDPVVLGASADLVDDTGNIDGRALIAGLALAGLIALRRMRVH